MFWYSKKHTEQKPIPSLEKRESYFCLEKDEETKQRTLTFESEAQKKLLSSKVEKIGYDETMKYLVEENLPLLFQNSVDLFKGDLVKTYRFFKAIVEDKKNDSYIVRNSYLGKIREEIRGGNSKEPVTETKYDSVVDNFHNLSDLQNTINVDLIKGYKGDREALAERSEKLQDIIVALSDSVADGIRKMPELRTQVKERKRNGEDVSDIQKYGLLERAGDGIYSMWSSITSCCRSNVTQQTGLETTDNASEASDESNTVEVKALNPSPQNSQQEVPKPSFARRMFSSCLPCFGKSPEPEVATISQSQ